MLEYYYIFKKLRFFQAGMLIDFFFKKCMYICLLYIYINCVKYVEKYFVEYIFLQTNRWLCFWFNVTDYFSLESFFSMLSVIVFIFIIVILAIKR
jgi:hypothetical protein